MIRTNFNGRNYTCKVYNSGCTQGYSISEGGALAELDVHMRARLDATHEWIEPETGEDLAPATRPPPTTGRRLVRSDRPLTRDFTKSGSATFIDGPHPAPGAMLTSTARTGRCGRSRREIVMTTTHGCLVGADRAVSLLMSAVWSPTTAVTNTAILPRTPIPCAGAERLRLSKRCAPTAPQG